MTAKAARSTLKCDNGAMSSAARLEQTPLPPLSVPEKKLELRGQIRATRKQRSANQQQKMAEALAGILEGVPELQAAQCVAAYVARPGEPGTEETLTRLREREIDVLLPVLTTGLERGWAYDSGPENREQAAPGRPPEPIGDHLPAETLAKADVILAPALAVDLNGVRLGQGGGWYDRALEHARSDALIIALVFDEEFVDDGVVLPQEPHDQLVHMVATPQRLIHLRAN